MTFVGEGLLDVVDVLKLDAELDLADEDLREQLRAIPAADRPRSDWSSFATYRAFDNSKRVPMPCAPTGSQTGPVVDLPSLLRDDLARSVARYRRGA
jgi:hypothetical protein